MSDRDRDVLALLDRAAAQSPSLHLTREDVVGRGRQLARRRRAASVGATLGGLALAGGLWLGLPGGGSVLGTPELAPASIAWEVDEPTTLTVLDGVSQGGDVSPLTVTKDGAGTSATFTVEGQTETVQGTTMAGGADVFVGERATVVLWEQPAGADQEVVPVPEPGGQWTSGTAASDQDVSYLVTTERGYVPEDLLLHDGTHVWTTSGEVADTAQVSDGRHRVTAFSLPGPELAGVLDAGSVHLLRTGAMMGGGDREPWWRGGDRYQWFVARAPEEASYLRMVWEDAEGEVARTGEAHTAVQLDGASLAVLSFTEAQTPVDRGDHTFDVQWSADGRTWHDRELEGVDEPVLAGVDLTLDADGRPVASGPDGPLEPVTGDLRGLHVWREAQDSYLVLGPTDDPLVLVVPDAEGRLLGHVPAQEDVRLGAQTRSAARLVADAAPVAALTFPEGLGHEATRWRFLTADDTVAEEVNGVPIIGSADQGLWFVGSDNLDGPQLELHRVGGGSIVPVDPVGARYAVVHVGGQVADGDAVRGEDAVPVLAPGASIVTDQVVATGGVGQDGPEPGLTMRATVVQCLVGRSGCVLGLDSTGDGAVDLPVGPMPEVAVAVGDQPEGYAVHGPGGQVELGARTWQVVETEAGWPALRAPGTALLDLAGDRAPAVRVSTLPGRWPWSRDVGVAVAMTGESLSSDLQVRVQDARGAWHAPEEVVVLQGSAGSVTVLRMPPGDVVGWTDVVGAVGADGEVALLTGPWSPQGDDIP